MIFITLDAAEAEYLYELHLPTRIHEKLRQALSALQHGVPEPRVILIRDEGDGLPFLCVTYDSMDAAARAFDEQWKVLVAQGADEKIEWP